MTQRLGSTPEYGGSVRELPRRKAERRSSPNSGPAALTPRTRTGRSSTPELTITYVQPMAENLLEAAEALSVLLLGTSEPVVGGRRRTYVRAGQ